MTTHASILEMFETVEAARSTLLKARGAAWAVENTAGNTFRQACERDEALNDAETLLRRVIRMLEE